MKLTFKNAYLITFGILLILAIAMQFTNEVQWKIGDFIIAAAILFTVTTSLLLINLYVKSKLKKTGLLLIVIILFILIWAELAVGIFNSPIAGS